jgi:hypothetical protein
MNYTQPFSLFLLVFGLSLSVWGQKVQPEKATLSIWDPKLEKQAIVLYASFDFQEYFEIIPHFVSQYPGKELVIYTPENAQIAGFINRIHRDKATIDSILDIKFGDHINLCRSKELYKSYLHTMVPYIQENKCTIIPYGNLSNAYQNGNTLPIDSMKKDILQSIASSIKQHATSNVLIIQPEGYIPFSPYLEAQLQSLNMALTKALFVPLKEKENPGHEYLRRQNPYTNLDNVSYAKLSPKGKIKFDYLALHLSSKLLPQTSQYYHYLLLAKKPEYLPSLETACCKK